MRKPLGGDRGSMILRRRRPTFDDLVAALKGKLAHIKAEIEADIDAALAGSCKHALAQAVPKPEILTGFGLRDILPRSQQFREQFKGVR